jgi:signal transduction histidine kinase
VSRDRVALAAIARHAGPALSAARRAGELSVAHSRLVVAREEERRRLRRDLHDDLAPTLSGISLGAAALSRSLAPTDPAHADRARDLHDDVQAAVLQARQIAYGLRPAVLDDLGLVAAIRDRVLTPDGPGVVIEVVGDDLPAALPAAVDVAALRIVQEAVANVRRHASASRCRVELRVVDADLVVTIADDGTGMPARYRPGMGLTSIRERASELGGHARISPAPGRGTLVTVRLPIVADLPEAGAVA